MPRFIGFCSRCGYNVDDSDRVCRCCGAETLDANLVAVLKRTSARRSRADRNEPAPPEDNLFPL